jgi:hypothetical protein
MADIFCNCCGLVFESRIVPCPRCMRCSRCGTKCPKGATNCPSFEHALDAASLDELEKRLDPTVSANRKTIRSCERDWENGQLMERLNFWGHAVFAVLAAMWVVLPELLKAAGIENMWVRVLVGTFLTIASLLGFFRLLRQGWLRVLLRKADREEESGGSRIP